MKLSKLLKTAANTLGAVGIAGGVMLIDAPEAKADGLKDLSRALRDISRTVRDLDRAIDDINDLGGKKQGNRYRSDCMRDWYRSNGSYGGTYNACEKERPRREMCILTDRRGREFIVECP